MKKDESSITMEDRREAKRRIEGSLAPDADFGLGPGTTQTGDKFSSLNPANIQ